MSGQFEFGIPENFYISEDGHSLILKGCFNDEMAVFLRENMRPRIVIDSFDFDDFFFLLPFSELIKELHVTRWPKKSGGLSELTGLIDLSIEGVPQPFELSKLKKLEALTIRYWHKKFLGEINQLPLLKKLFIRSYDQKDDAGFHKMTSLNFLDMREGSLQTIGKNLPSSLKELELYYLRKLGDIFSPFNIETLVVENCSSLEKINFEKKTNPKKIVLRVCKKLRQIELPTNMNLLTELTIDECPELNITIDLSRFENLEKLTIDKSSQVKLKGDLPSPKKLKNLWILGEYPEFNITIDPSKFENLEWLAVDKSSQRKLVGDLSSLKKLRGLRIFGKNQEVDIMVDLSKFENLEELLINKGSSVKLEGNLFSLKKLRLLLLFGKFYSSSEAIKKLLDEQARIVG
jgi:hypothetical protein